MSRKDMLRAILTQRDERLPGGNSPSDKDAGTSVEASSPLPDPAAPALPVNYVRSGAVGAMGRSLGQIANAAEQARALIASGSAVIEISGDRLDASFIADRLPGDGPDYERLREAIRESGQRSPILVRPHPAKPDRYQIVFGHRRVRVMTELGRPVRAVVQSLSDEELVVIQGQENSARADLSYIERGLFAQALETQGFDRRVIMAALGMEKTQLSRLMFLARTIPDKLISAIGPAPKAGRPRWSALAERMVHFKDVEGLARLLLTPEFKGADSDARFNRVFDAVALRGSVEPRPVVWKAPDGRKVAKIERKGAKVSLTIDEEVTPAFGAFVIANLAALLVEFDRQQKEVSGLET